MTSRLEALRTIIRLNGPIPCLFSYHDLYDVHDKDSRMTFYHGLILEHDDGDVYVASIVPLSYNDVKPLPIGWRSAREIARANGMIAIRAIQDRSVDERLAHRILRAIETGDRFVVATFASKWRRPRV